MAHERKPCDSGLLHDMLIVQGDFGYWCFYPGYKNIRGIPDIDKGMSGKFPGEEARGDMSLCFCRSSRVYSGHEARKRGGRKIAGSLP